MQWTRLTLKDFLSHRDTTLDLTALNLIVGPNGSGKSSIRDAIQWAITGSCRGMTKQKDRIGVIRQGAKKAKVALTTKIGDEIYFIDRTATASGSNLVLTNVDTQQEWIGTTLAQPEVYRLLGINEEIATLLFDAYALPTMSAANRKKILQRLFSIEGKSALVKYLVDLGFGNMPKEHKQAVVQAYKENGIGTAEKGAYGYAVGKRRQFKRDLDTLEGTRPTSPGGGDDLLTMDELQANLTKETAERDEIKRLVAYDQGKIDAREHAIADMEKSLEVLSAELVSPEKIQAEKDVATEGRDEARALLDGLTVSKIPRAEGDSSPIGNGIGQHIIPPHEREMNTLARLERLKTELADIPGISVKSLGGVAKAIKTAEEKTKFEPKTYDEIDKEIESARQALLEAETKLTDALAWAADEEQAIQDHAHDEKMLETMRAGLKTLLEAREAGTSEESKDEKLSYKNAEISDVQISIQTVSKIEEYDRLAGEYKISHQKITDRITRWDKLAKALDPKNEGLGVLLGEKYRTFRAFVLGVSTQLGVPATVNKDFSVEMTTKDGPISNLEWASKSEQYRVGVAILLGLCDLRGIKSAVLDEGEVVFGENKTAFRKMLKSVPGGMSTLILLETGDPHAPPSKNPDISIHNIVAGEVLN